MHVDGGESAGGLTYTRLRPEETGFYRRAERHPPAFAARLAEQGLPAPIEQDFEAYLQRVRLERRLLCVAASPATS